MCASVFINSTNLIHPDITGYEDNLETFTARWFGIKAAKARLIQTDHPRHSGRAKLANPGSKSTAFRHPWLRGSKLRIAPE